MLYCVATCCAVLQRVVLASAGAIWTSDAAAALRSDCADLAVVDRAVLEEVQVEDAELEDLRTDSLTE